VLIPTRKELLALSRQVPTTASTIAPMCRISCALSLHSPRTQSQYVAIMNWTGGSLQRTKTAHRGAVLQQQRAYFAKARTQLQDNTHSPIAPFRPSYLCDTEESGFMAQMPSFGSGSVRHTGHSARRRGERMRRETMPFDEPLVDRDMETKIHEETPMRDHESRSERPHPRSYLGGPRRG
jgi:hypothetical protein